MIGRLLIGSLCWCCVTAATVDAQTRPATAGRIEVAGGGGLLGGGDLGTSDANLRANSLTPTPYRLFTTTSSFATAPLVEGRIGVNLSRHFAVEGRFGFSRPQLRTSISSDAEQGNALTAVERLDQYMVDGSVVLTLDRLRRGELVPFAVVGAGYLRELHEGQALIEHGHDYHVGGGVRRRLFVHNRGFMKTGGVRADLRVYLLSGGAAFDTATHPRVAASGSFFVGF
jgi:hypothetical protein